MERWRDTVVSRELERVRDWVYPPDHLEWAHKSRAEFPTGQLQFQVPGGKPDSVARLILGGIPTATVRVEFLLPDCSADLEVGQLPDPLSSAEPIINDRDVRLGGIPGTERWLVS